MPPCILGLLLALCCLRGPGMSLETSGPQGFSGLLVPREGAPSTRAALCSSAYCQGSGWPGCTDGHRSAIQLGTEVGQRGSSPLPPQQARASPWQCPDTFGVKAGPGRGKGKQTWWLRLALPQVCPVATGSGRACGRRGSFRAMAPGQELPRPCGCRWCSLPGLAPSC